MRMKSLDSLPINESSISLLKIDTIGYEKFVLLGGLKCLKKIKCIHIPIIEKDFRQYGYSFQEIFDILHQNGFKLFRFSDKKIIRHISEPYVPCNEDILAISNMNDFLNRTKYELR